MSLRDLKDRAARLIGSGQYERAEVLLRQALTQAPRDVATWLKHAEVQKRLSRNVGSISSYRLAARILDDDGHHHRAVAALKLALAMVPDDVDLYAEIIRCELRARKTAAGMRSMFPLSSPSQILGASSEAFPLSTTRLDDTPPPKQLALPMSSSATIGRTRSAEHRADTWLPEPDQPSRDAHQPRDREPTSHLPTDERVPTLDTQSGPTLDAPNRLTPHGLPGPTADALPGPTADALHDPTAEEPHDPTADERVRPPAPAASAPLRFEVSSEERWPQVVRLSEQKVAVRHAPDARWVVLEASTPLSVQFEPFLELPETAEWLE